MFHTGLEDDGTVNSSKSNPWLLQPHDDLLACCKHEELRELPEAILTGDGRLVITERCGRFP